MISIGAEGPEEGVHPGSQNVVVRTRCNWKYVIAVPHAEGAFFVLEPHLLSFKCGAVRAAQDRQEHLVGELGLEWTPIDVEDGGVP
jgi:hypothetical protein